MHYFKHIFHGGMPAVLACFMMVLFACQPSKPKERLVVNPFPGVDTAQVDAVLNAMTADEKIGQLILLRSDVGDSVKKVDLIEDVAAGRVGGLLLENLWIEDYLYLKDSIDRIAKLPLFMGTRQKVSLFNQFKGLQHLPSPAAIVAIDSTELEEMLLRHYLQQCKVLGINFSINPTCGLDYPANPVFDEQLFESDTLTTANRAHKMMKALQANEIIAVGSGFSELLFLENDSLRDSILHRFLLSTRQGLGGLLVDETVFKSDTLKKARPGFVNRYLHRYLDFNGLTVVSLEDVKTLEDKWTQGVDLFITEEADAVFKKLVQLHTTGKLNEKSLDDRIRNILFAKAWANGGELPVELSILPTDSVEQPVRFVSLSPKRQPQLVRNVPPRPKDLAENIETIRCYFEDPNWLYFSDLLLEKTIVLANNHDRLLPIQNLLGSRFEVFEYGRQPFREFKRVFFKYAHYGAQELHPVTAGELKPVSPKTTDDNLVAIVLLDSINLSPGRHKAFIDSLDQLSKQRKTVLVNFGNPKNFQFFDTTLTCVQVFQRNNVTEAYAAQVLFGGVPVTGKMPIEVSNAIPYGASVKNNATRLGFGNSEKVGVSEERLVGINAIAETAIDRGVFPGCQVAVAKDGQIIFSEAFGNHSYGTKSKPVNPTDLYDIASVTKVAATTLAVMDLYQKNSIDLKSEVGDYIPIRKGAPVGAIKIRELLLHNSGLQSQMPIGKFYSWRNVPAKGCNTIFCRMKRRDFNVQVAKGLYFRNDYRDTIFARVKRLPVGPKRYRYSDVNFFLLQKISESLTKTPMDRFLKENYYHPLGLRYITFNPVGKFGLDKIVPTENDRAWRHTLVEGFVHDPAAALLGGVSGNAGLFSNAEDLAVLFQLFLNGGSYGGRQYLTSETVDAFTKEYAGSRRSLGFEKPAEKRYPSYSKQSSPQSYGHTGFTGTCVWVDPENNLVYVFLSNRIHPSARNAKIFTEAVRSRIHEVVYDAFGTFQMQLPELSVEVKSEK